MATTAGPATGHAAAALDFLRTVAKERNPRAAFAKHVAARFVHHNPHFAAGRDSLMEAMVAAHETHPDTAVDVQRVLADGDLVAVHSRVRPDPEDRGLAVVHLFRFEGDKIAEFWDVAQPVPESSPNASGMF
jgi:predicted SnoaL-like aldol condensation-catalyzing enzyme